MEPFRYSSSFSSDALVPHGKGGPFAGNMMGGNMMGGNMMAGDPQAMMMGAMMGANMMMFANMMGGNMKGARWDPYGGDSWEDDAVITYKGKGKGKRW